MRKNNMDAVGTSRRCFPPGLTLIELVVVLSITAVLVLLLLVGVQAVRETARKAKCQNNIRQLGVAIHSYSVSINAFPQGNNGHGFSVHAMILPYIDQVAIYNSINFQAMARSSARFGTQNSTAFSVKLGMFICESDRNAGIASGTSYAGNRGTGVQKNGYDGAFAYERKGAIGYADFSDGTSATLAMAEWISGSRSYGRRGSVVFETPISLEKSGQLDEFASACMASDLSSSKLSPLVKGESWLIGELSYTLYNHVVKINGPSCTNGGLVQEGAFSAGSSHGNGVNVLFVDGHVAYVADSVELKVWRALGSRNGGDQSGVPAF